MVFIIKKLLYFIFHKTNIVFPLLLLFYYSLSLLYFIFHSITPEKEDSLSLSFRSFLPFSLSLRLQRPEEEVSLEEIAFVESWR